MTWASSDTPTIDSFPLESMYPIGFPAIFAVRQARERSLAGQEEPQAWNPVLHLYEQLSPSHVGSAPGGGVQGEQRLPQESVLVLGRQASPQRWLAMGQLPSQGTVAAIQSPWQRRISSGQARSHRDCTHIARPPLGATQGSHKVPHDAGLMSSAHRLSQAWNPGRHWSRQVPPTHWEFPLGSTAQRAHDGPQAAGSSLVAHRDPHFVRSASHEIPQLVPSQVAAPPTGTGHAEQETGPQWSGLPLETQAPPQA